MSATAIFLEYLGIAAAAATVVGLLWRGRARRSPAFTVYLAGLVVASVLMLGWPQIFWTPRFWRVTDPIALALLAATAVEVARHGLRRVAGLEGAVVVLVAIGVLAAAFVWPSPDVLGPLPARVDPYLRFGLAWVFGALVVLFAWCRSPASRLDWAIVAGLAFHQLVVGVIVERLAPRWAASTQPFAVSFLLVATLWLAEAWRVDQPTRAS
jgi:hypothetical protein